MSMSRPSAWLSAVSGSLLLLLVCARLPLAFAFAGAGVAHAIPALAKRGVAVAAYASGTSDASKCADISAIGASWYYSQTH